MSTQRVIIIGAGGFAREVLDVLEAANARTASYEILGFIVDPQYAEPGMEVNGKPILGGFEWLGQHVDDVSAICGVGSPDLRYQLVERARKLGVRFFSVIHPQAIFTRWVTVGEGTIVTAGCILTNRITLGNHVQVNLDCTVGHDTVAEDFVTLAPGVHVSGNVTLCEGCSVGTGANIIEKKNVGSWATIGAGTTVISDVPPNSTVVGVPGKVVRTKPSGWHRECGNGASADR